MLASTESGTYQFAMADDSMEISSEHGHNVGDDIDIDIDFTNGHADEDDILQDADYDNDFPLQPSPEMHHDDLMVDDDNASYQMDDADLIHDEAEQIIETEATLIDMADPFSTMNDDDGNTVAYSEEHDIGLFFNQQDEQVPDATVDDPLQDSKNASHQEDIATASEDVVPHEDNLPTDESTFQEVEGVGKGESHHESAFQEIERVGKEESHHESQDSTPHNRTPAVGPAEPRSPPTSISGLDTSSLLQESNNTVPDPDQNSLHEDFAKPHEPSSVDRIYNLSNAYAMKVAYQSVEYALFSTAESDDPDSFFLSDITIMEKPLSDLFKAIREIIHDDLAEEDEMCLSVEDLGLETEEASSCIQDITLAKILNLYESLLRNDGVDSARPLYLILSTRANFRLRFLNLHKGASQGKGLSELVVWDQNSESLDDVEEKDEVTDGIETNLIREAVQDAGDGQGIETENKDSRPTAEKSVEFHEEEHQTDLTEEHKENYEEENEEEYEDNQEEKQLEEDEPEPKPTAEDSAPTAAPEHTRESDDVANARLESQCGSPQQPITQGTGSTNPLTSTEVEAANGEDNEEDDLIDYSDGEIQHPAEQNIEEHRTSVVTDENRTDTEYQAKEEELRRRSISRQAKEKLLEQSLDQTYTDTNDSSHPEEYFEGEGTGYDEYNAEFYGDQNDSYELVEHTGEANLNGHEDQNGLFDSHESFDNDEVTCEHTAEIGAEGYEDVNEENVYQAFEEFGNEKVKPQGLPAYAEGTTSHEVSDFVEVNGKDVVHEHSTTSSLGVADTTESSVTLGAEGIGYQDDLDEEISNELKELENATTPTNGSNLEPKDEIDYEDDEDEEVPISPGPGAVAATKELPNANGKRSIAEVESIVSTPSKDAKRPRS